MAGSSNPVSQLAPDNRFRWSPLFSFKTYHLLFHRVARRRYPAWSESFRWSLPLLFPKVKRTKNERKLLTLTRTFFLSIGLTTSPTYDPCSCKSCSSSLNIRTTNLNFCLLLSATSAIGKIRMFITQKYSIFSLLLL